ncbi:Endoribonuclease toxin MazF [Moorella thermoacetica]|uniref:Endoribonuclease toxin MazF n=1 Tax=Neomoorella thermoacetica TaxID=1525 RepID=A0AAC9MUP7_NEOTH|nr:endoribonuclease MazF [Moorella thermoacetica]AOQ23701.1 mRNA interferase MazF [Moorella thermoacetica]TYL13886.1 Endoribonuclease toxin MazF [Moorella thermoacetica]
MVNEMETYIPERGDIVWLQFDPRAGHEQAGRRQALVISPQLYNGKVGLALFCPVTTKAKGYPFEVAIPAGLKITGVILADQVKNLDWRAREAQFACKVPAGVVAEVQAKVQVLIS